jgi:hypothetical protein
MFNFPLNTSFSSQIQTKNTLPLLSAPVVSGAGERLERTGEDTAGAESTGGTHISCPPLVVNRAFDTLEINYKIDYLRSVGLFTNLESKKFALLSGMENEIAFKFFSTDDYSFSLQRSGKKYFPFCVRSGDIFLFLSPRSPESPVPNMSLKIGSLTCQGDLDQFFLYFHRFLRLLGCKVVEEIVSRFDICTDIAQKISESGVDDLSKQICRSERSALYFSRKEFTGISIGKGAISCRIYDKIREMKDKQDSVKTAFFYEKWADSGDQFTDITRVEFQLRREFLKEIGVTDYKSLVSVTHNIWTYCTEKWLRYASRSVDRLNKNHSQSGISDFWAIVQGSFDGSVSVTRKRVVNTCNIEALGKQIRGCMTTILASVGFESFDFWGMMETTNKFINGAMSSYLCSPEFVQRFEARQKRYVPVF